MEILKESWRECYLFRAEQHFVENDAYLPTVYPLTGQIVIENIAYPLSG